MTVTTVTRSIAAAALAAAAFTGGAFAADEAKHPKEIAFSFDGPFGKFDKAQLQRGLKVYQNVCANCHGMEHVYYRNLGQKGGPFYEAGVSPAENPYVQTIASSWAYQIEDGPDDYGDMFMRARKATDPFLSPFANQAAARAANNGAYPVDLSLITKARMGGPEYIYSLLIGYDAEPPEGSDDKFAQGLYYNPYYAGGWIGMPQQLYPGIVEYDDGVEATPDQMAKDVTAFLHWAAEPKLEQRKATGLVTMIYLVILAGLLYLSYKRLWRNVEH